MKTAELLKITLVSMLLCAFKMERTYAIYGKGQQIISFETPAET